MGRPSIRPCIRLFLSTPSARRATTSAGIVRCGCPISIHALREEGDGLHLHPLRQDAISIHALREEGDLYRPKPYWYSLEFLSTPSARRATEYAGIYSASC